MEQERNSKFEIYRDQGENREFRWRLVAPNGEIIASGEGYTTRQKCEDGIKDIKKYAPIAQVVSD
jgi:uncharacterized protein YegP (UPF0339 family)